MDSSFIAGLNDSRDINHSAAVELQTQIQGGIYGPLVISDYIFDETITLIAVRTKNIGKTIELGEHLLNSEIDLLEVKTEVFNAAWELFKKRKNLSFTDCTTIELMKANDVKHLASFDEGFKQFGKEINLLR